MQDETKSFLNLLKEYKRLLFTKTKNLVSDDPIDTKIDQINRKSIIGALITTILIDIFAVPACPMLDKVSLLSFDLVFLMGWTCIISAFAFTVTGSLFIHTFGRELVDEAKKRGKYLFKLEALEHDEFRSSFDDNIRDYPSPSQSITTDPSYSFHPANIHYTGNIHSSDRN